MLYLKIKVSKHNIFIVHVLSLCINLNILMPTNNVSPIKPYEF